MAWLPPILTHCKQLTAAFPSPAGSSSSSIFSYACIYTYYSLTAYHYINHNIYVSGGGGERVEDRGRLRQGGGGGGGGRGQGAGGRGWGGILSLIPHKTLLAASCL